MLNAIILKMYNILIGCYVLFINVNVKFIYILLYAVQN